MDHVVFYPDSDDEPAFRRFDAMDDAVSFVEHLRNADGVTEASLYALTPVPLVVKTYFRVEVPPVDLPVEQPPSVGEAYPAVGADADVPADGEAGEQPVLGVPEQVASTESDDAPADEVPAAVGTPDIIAPAGNNRRTLGFFSH